MIRWFASPTPVHPGIAFNWVKRKVARGCVRRVGDTHLHLFLGLEVLSAMSLLNNHLCDCQSYSRGSLLNIEVTCHRLVLVITIDSAETSSTICHNLVAIYRIYSSWWPILYKSVPSKAASSPHHPHFWVRNSGWKSYVRTNSRLHKVNEWTWPSQILVCCCHNCKP